MGSAVKRCQSRHPEDKIRCVLEALHKQEHEDGDGRHWPRLQHNHSALPPYKQLLAEYMAGASYQMLARKYGVRTGSVLNKLRRNAVKNGDPWPVKMQDPDWRKKAGVLHSKVRWDSVDSMLIRYEIQECCQEYGITLRGFARLMGLSSPAWVFHVSAGILPRISRVKAQEVERVVRQVEKGWYLPDDSKPNMKRWKKDREKKGQKVAA